MTRQNQFGSTYEAIFYPILLLVIMWLTFWADHLFELIDFYKYGVLPHDIGSLKGVLLMPFIHSKDGFEHITNNSLPIVILLGTLIYYYRSIALKVFVMSWIGTGLGVWLFAANEHSYHIGMSGVIYALVGFLFTSGVLRKYRPLQAISLFVTFVYGSLIWGIFPIEPQVSWQGHLAGLVMGVLLAIVYRKKGPQPPKYFYEIEKEMGIDPPDFEGEWNERVRQEKLRQEERIRSSQERKIIYHFKSSNDSNAPKEESEPDQ